MNTDYDPTAFHALRDAAIKEFGYTPANNGSGSGDHVFLNGDPFGIDIYDKGIYGRGEKDQRFVIGVNFTNELVQHRSSNAPRLEITVAKSKSPEQIIKEIKRRLIAPANEEAALRLERKAGRDAYEAKLARNKAILALAAHPIEIDGPSWQRDTHQVSARGLHYVSVDGRVTGDGLHITSGNLPLSIAVELFKMIAAYKKDTTESAA